MTFQNQQRLWTLTAVSAIAVMLFWWLGYPALLNYHEQQQLFLYTWDYTCEVVKYPGGVAHYIAEFLTQFGLIAWAAALVKAFVFVAVQRTVWRLMKGAAVSTYALSFVPGTLMMLAMGDDNTMLCAEVAMAIALAVALLMPKGRGRLVFTIASATILYWLIGPAAGITIAIAAAQEGEQRGVKSGLLMFVVGMALLALTVYIAMRTVPYMGGVIVKGIYYYRYALSMNSLIVISMVFAAAMPACRLWLARLNTKHDWRWATASVLLMALCVKLLLPVTYTPFAHDTIEYVCLEREGRWDDIIAKAEKHSPEGGVGLAAVNLALAHKGQLCNRLFDFDQHGMEGLIPPYKINSPVTLAASEICYQVGLVNEAQRYAFDSMESMVNGKKSARIIKRLAETNLINGDYDVAMKYLMMLRKTLFYRQWATKTLALLGNEEAINIHPEYGRLRQIKITNDYLASEKEIDKMIGQVYLRNTSNSLAMQYLLAIPLIRRDLPTLLRYNEIVNEDFNFKPRAITEAIAYAYAQQGKQPPAGVVSDYQIRRLRDFVGIVNSEHNPDSPRLAPFKNTAWYYLAKHEKEE